MEIALNLLWAVLAVVTIRLWARYVPRSGANRWAQPVALALSLWILFPVISLTDDLQAAQNLAEADIFIFCTRQEHVASLHSALPSGAALPPPFFTELSFDFLRLAVPFNLLVPVVDNPALTSIQNRPPPAA